MEDFQENILGRAILVYDRYCEQSVGNLTKRKALTPEFSGGIFNNGWLWRVASEKCEISACNSLTHFYNVRLNANIEFRKITTSEPLPSTE